MRPPKLLALARNYQDHITEAGLPPVDKQRIVPKLFLKPSSAIIGPGDTLCLPGVSHANDWEVELAVVIGTRCRNIGPARALDMVFGYTIANDVSARTTEWSVERDPDKWNEFFDWLNGKWPDGFAPLGPYPLTADEEPDPQALDLSLSVNGERKQHSSTREMISTVAETAATRACWVATCGTRECLVWKTRFTVARAWWRRLSFLTIGACSPLDARLTWLYSTRRPSSTRPPFWTPNSFR